MKKKEATWAWEVRPFLGRFGFFVPDMLGNFPYFIRDTAEEVERIGRACLEKDKKK